jgi:hypothetical protein
VRSCTAIDSNQNLGRCSKAADSNQNLQPIEDRRVAGGNSLRELFDRKSTILVALGISVVFLVCLEMVIYIAAASSAGERSRVEVRDKQGQVIYSTPGSAVSQIDRMSFEREFGELHNYDVAVTTGDSPFPVRAWVAASVGIPIVLILLISYMIKVYMVLLHGSDGQGRGGLPSVGGKPHPFIFLANFISSHSIFYLGTFISLAALVFWMLPNFVAELIGLSINILRENKWFVLAPVIALTAFIVWVVYLRYRLARRMMDHQFTLERYRLDYEMRQQKQLAPEELQKLDKGLENMDKRLESLDKSLEA